ncbi:MAG: DUF2207 domain-containing protein [Clostridia bacterium]|nr:DUF2207 domain-containing protein [Clostridia bacterium]
MHRRFIAALIALLLACPAALAGEAVNYEISSYALYMTVQPDGDVRVREQVIYSNPSVYDGLTLTVSLEGADGIADIEAWADGEALDELPADADRLGEARGFTVVRAAERAVIDILSPGDNDWRTFACAYTLRGLAKRYEDTALIERTLVPAGRDALFQNAAVIVTLPRSDGEVLTYVDGAPEDIPVLLNYDTVNIGPLDIAADESLSMQMLFPAEWLDEAAVTPGAVRESVVKPREAEKAAAERETNARRAEQYTAIAVYALLVGATLFLLARKYGMRGKPKGEPDEALLDKYPAALAGYAAAEESTPDMLAGTLAELEAEGALTARRDENGVTLRPARRPEGLAAHQAAALDWVFADGGEGKNLAALNAGNDYARAQAIEKGYLAYGEAVSQDMIRAGLKWNNETLLIVAGLVNVLFGVILGMVLLLVGKRMALEAGAVAVFMLVMTKQFERVRHLTDDGERLRQAALSFGGMAERSQEELAARLPVTAALGGAARCDSEQGRLWKDAADAIRDAHIHNASLRRARKAK